jgi:hypothetical protein
MQAPNHALPIDGYLHSKYISIWLKPALKFVVRQQLLTVM